jgi:hypothetical protein
VNSIDPNLDQRLSDYLDNRLDAAARAEIEQAIQQEDESQNNGLRAQLDQMRYLRDSLKQLAARDAGRKLDDGFADRVIQAAVTRALEEGVSSDHPLIRVASQPGTVSTTAARSPWNRRTLAIVVSVAASIALAIFVVNRESVPSGSISDQAVSLADNAVIPSAPTPSLETTVGPETVLSEADSRIALTSPEVNTVEPSVVERSQIEPPTTAPAALASSPPAPSSLLAETGTAKPDSSVAFSGAVPNKLAAIIVLEVRQTESGRIAGAVRRAMQQAGIQRSDEKPITADIADSASQTVGLRNDEMVSLVYLQASAKNIDQFYINLFDDQEGVQSVSLAIATEAPVLNIVNSATLDPTTVSRQGGSAIELPEQIDPVANLNFAKVSREAVQGMTLSSGPDFAAQLLVVIR